MRSPSVLGDGVFAAFNIPNPMPNPPGEPLPDGLIESFFRVLVYPTFAFGV